MGQPDQQTMTAATTTILPQPLNLAATGAGREEAHEVLFSTCTLV